MLFCHPKFITCTNFFIFVGLRAHLTSAHSELSNENNENLKNITNDADFEFSLIINTNSAF